MRKLNVELLLFLIDDRLRYTANIIFIDVLIRFDGV